MNPAPDAFLVRIAPGRAFAYKYAELVAAADAAPERFRLQFTDEDVAAYRVEAQPSPRAELALTPAASARLRGSQRPGYALYGALFDVRLGGARQFVALGYERIGAAAIGAPVVHPEGREEGLILRFGSAQGSWYGGRTAIAGEQAIDTAALREHFRARGRLEVVALLEP